MVLKKSSKNLGCQGEDLAVQFLRQKGYVILGRNYRTRWGEIDIVAREGNFICFVEVKTRMSILQGTPFEAVSLLKQRKISRMALDYLARTHQMDCLCRFDVVGVDLSKQDKPVIELLAHAFEAIT